MKALRAGLDTGCLAGVPILILPGRRGRGAQDLELSRDRAGLASERFGNQSRDASQIRCVSVHAAAALAILLLAGCSDKPVVVTSVDTFCTRVERFHATDAERAALKANSGPLERIIRWMAGINEQYDSACLKPGKGA